MRRKGLLELILIVKNKHNNNLQNWLEREYGAWDYPEYYTYVLFKQYISLTKFLAPPGGNKRQMLLAKYLRSGAP